MTFFLKVFSFNLTNSEYIPQNTSELMLMPFHTFIVLNEDVDKSNPDMLPPDAKIPPYDETIDFTRNLGAMSVNKKNGIIEMVCEASDYGIHHYYKKFWGIFPKGKIHFNFNAHDYYPASEEEGAEIAGSKYISDTGKYKLLIIND